MVFLVNFTMDFILLVIASGFLKTSTTYTRAAVAAAVGAVWACVVETGIIKNVFIRDIFTYILVCAAMAAICYGCRRISGLIKPVFVFIILASSIGGAANLLYRHTVIGFWFRTMALDNMGLFVCLLAAMIALTIVLRQFLLQNTYGGKIHNVKIDFGGFVLEVKGLADTGNVLRDPFCNKPVHVIEKSCLIKDKNNTDIYEKLLAVCKDIKLHYISFSSVGCENRCMPVIMAKTLCISMEDSNKNNICLNDVPIGISETKLSSDGIYQMLINSEVIK